MKTVSEFLVGAAVTIISAIFSGYVLSVLWTWFIVPLGVGAISIAQALGIALIAGLITKEHLTEKNETPFWIRILVSFFADAAVLGFGWVYHSFM